MFLIDNILVDERVVTTPFLCDTTRCKGACCTVKGGQGAPLLDEEIPALEQSIGAASRYLTEKSKAALAERGAFEGEAGGYTTQCIDDALSRKPTSRERAPFANPYPAICSPFV